MLRSSSILRLLAVIGLPIAVSAQAINYWNVNDTATVPKALSATGVFSGITGKHPKMIKVVHKFDVNSVLWSDAAHKTRWVAVKPNQSITFKENEDYFGYPDSAMFVKQFDIDTIPGDTTSRVMWETRILYNRKEVLDSTKVPMVKMDHWWGYSYKWNADQKDAALIGLHGSDDSIRTYPNGKSKPMVMKKWHFPSRDQCELCHRLYADTVQGRSVLGFFTAQLNHPHPDAPTINQLDSLFTAKVLTGTKPANWNLSPHWRAIEDSTATLDIRARSYIGANCSGCHGRRGIENSATFGVDLNYDFYTMESKMEFRHRSVSYPFGLDDPSILPYYYPKTDTGNNPLKLDSIQIVPALVVPGYPQKSVILYRQRSRDTVPGNYDPTRDQMPPLATFEVNGPATKLISDWILTMPAIAAPNSHPIITGIHNYAARMNLLTPTIQGRQVLLPRGALYDNMKVEITGISGRTEALRQVGHGVFAIPSGYRAGIYIIRVGSQKFTRYLF